MLIEERLLFMANVIRSFSFIAQCDIWKRCQTIGNRIFRVRFETDTESNPELQFKTALSISSR